MANIIKAIENLENHLQQSNTTQNADFRMTASKVPMKQGYQSQFDKKNTNEWNYTGIQCCQFYIKIGYLQNFMQIKKNPLFIFFKNISTIVKQF